MTQNNLYMEDDNMRLYVDVQPLFIDELENSKNAAAASAQQAAQSEANARTWKNDIIDYKTGLELFYAQASDGITNSYNISISGLSAAKSSAINDLNSQKSSIQSSLNNSLNSAMNNIATNGQNYVNQARSYAEEAQRTVDNRVSKDHLNQSKGLETGSVSTDEEVLADVKKYAHSTYCGDQTEGSTPGYLQDGITPLDPKKFIKVGSPNITDDGIASGFSSSNYLISQQIDRSKPFVQKIKINTGVSFNDSSGLFVENINTLYLSRIQFNLLSNGKGVVRTLLTSDGSSGFDIGSTVGAEENALSINTDYYLRFSWTGTQYITETSIDDENYIIQSTIDSTVPLRNVPLLLGKQGVYYFNGSIDLKQFSITVDGVPVFSGNKTGVDTIKDNSGYTIYPASDSSIVVDENSIASGFASNNYLRFVNDFTNKDKWELYVPFKFDDISEAHTIISNPASNSNAISISDSKLKFSYCIVTESQSYIWYLIGHLTLQSDTWYIVKLTYNKNTGYILSVSDDNGKTYKDALLLNNTNKLTVSSGNAWDFGLIAGTYAVSTGLHIDLKGVRVYTDDTLSYRPCLKIPYTESKTGSKIVNAIYRDRVQDMYQQFGYAPFYTLSDTDFTLPMGDIYGMIENLRKLIIQRTS